MSPRDPLKSPVFTVLLATGPLWLVSGLVLVWRSIPARDGPAKAARDFASGRTEAGDPATGDVRLRTAHWAGLLAASLAGYGLFRISGLPGAPACCAFTAGIAILGIVASRTGPAFPPRP
jgi:hypothetical protein